ncbi:MAG: hypothetical protein PHE24_05750 [Patescibacteria group bacterium]|nr:hypothetical protein [Patescibacteria group bacterium]
MKAAYLHILATRIDGDWVRHVLDKGFDLVFYVDYLESDKGPQTSTWALQRTEQPCTLKGKSIVDWLTMRLEQKVPNKKSYFWFISLPSRKDYSSEIRNYLVGGGVDVIDVDIRQVKNTADIDAVLAKQ